MDGLEINGKIVLQRDVGCIETGLTVSDTKMMKGSSTTHKKIKPEHAMIDL